MQCERKSQGFTLIELLVVIAIIAILAAILFPVFAQARESARTSSCLSNMKQISLAIIQYEQDYDERHPLGHYDYQGPAMADAPWGKWPNKHIGWDKAVYPYAKNVQIFKCPSGDDSQKDGNPGDDSARTGSVDYAMNGRLVNGGIKIAGVRFPAVTILLMETTGNASSTGARFSERGDEWGYQERHARQLNGDNYSWPGDDPSQYGPARDTICKSGTRQYWGSGAALRRHKGGANYAYSDGHTKFTTGDASCVVWDRSNQGGVAGNESGSTMTYIP